MLAGISVTLLYVFQHKGIMFIPGTSFLGDVPELVLWDRAQRLWRRGSDRELCCGVRCESRICAAAG